MNKKPSREAGRVKSRSGLETGLCADDVGCLEAFRSLQQIKLHGLTFIQSTIAVFLNGGKVNEHVFSGGPLDEAVSFSPVEPLDCTLLSHEVNSFRLCIDLSAASPAK